MASLSFCMVVGILLYHVFVEVVNGRVLPSNNSSTNGLTKYINGLPAKIGEIHKGEIFYEDFNKSGLLKNISLSNIHPLSQGDNFINHWATIKQRHLIDEHYGAKATINVYGLPQVGADQYSEAGIWLTNNEYGTFNSISAGWHVHPRLYGDHDTHFFVHWSVRERGTSCYNLLCKGFVAIKSSNNFVPGRRIRPVSKVNGKQYEITIKIFKDSTSGDWWLYVAGRYGNKPVGYWPNSLFTSLAESANNIEWGGVVGFYKGQKSPPMGNGRYPHEGKAAFFKNVSPVYGDGYFLGSVNTERFEDKTDCYQLDGDENKFYFGGPGGCLD